MTQVQFDVDGMKCSGCESLIVSSLKDVDGVQEVNADHKTGQVTISFDAAVMPEEEIKQIIRAQGYTPQG